MICHKNLKALVLFGLLIALFVSFDTFAQTTLSSTQTLSLPPDPNPLPFPHETRFGCHVAIDGQWMLVAPCAGRAVYAYKKNEAGQWLYNSELVFPEDLDGFVGLVLSDKTAVLSTGDIGNGRDDSGFLYVFVRHGDTWRFVQRLTEPEPSSNFYAFGFEIAFSGNTFVATNLLEGAAYVYSRKPNGKLIYRTKLTPVAGAVYFGIEVAADANTIAVSSREDGGSVHLYRPSHGGWALEQTLKSPPVGGDPGYERIFGSSIALSGKTLIVSSPTVDATIPYFRSGAAFVYRRNEGDWQYEARLDNPLGTLGGFGGQVVINGRRAAVTAPAAVFTFARSGGSWSPEGYVLGDDPFQRLVLELDRRTLAVGQPFLTNPSSPAFDGQVDIFRVPGDEQP